MYLSVGSADDRTRGTGGIGGLGLFGQPSADPVAALGNALWQEAPAGVTVAIFYADPEQKRRAVEWAARERAIGPRTGGIAAPNLAFGHAIADSGNLATQLATLRTVLTAAVAAVPQPPGMTPLPGTGPSLIRTLALFTHGTTGWVSVGGGVTTKSAAALIKRIAAALTDDVKIIMYGCSSARGQSEASDWVTTTMSAGGEDSLAARIRDALVDAGKSRASVWGHTEVGHTTRNPSLRTFGAGFGKGTKGSSYVGETIFGTVPEVIILDELEVTLGQLGFSVDDAHRDAFRRALRKQLKRMWYLCNLGANIRYRMVAGKKVKENNLTLNGANLSEVAPVHPLEVADIVRRHWSQVCWSPAEREQLARKLAKEVKLPAMAHANP
jgi:hypothetical protein